MNKYYIAGSCSARINFTINRKKIFKGNDNLLGQLVWYFILAVFSATISGILVLYISIPSAYIKIIIETILYFWNYYIQRIFAFAKTNKIRGVVYETNRNLVLSMVLISKKEKFFISVYRPIFLDNFGFNSFGTK